jgi:hypothetical protein
VTTATGLPLPPVDHCHRVTTKLQLINIIIIIIIINFIFVGFNFGVKSLTYITVSVSTNTLSTIRHSAGRKREYRIQMTSPVISGATQPPHSHPHFERFEKARNDIQTNTVTENKTLPILKLTKAIKQKRNS